MRTLRRHLPAAHNRHHPGRKARVRCLQLRRQGRSHQQALLRRMHRLQALRKGLQVRRHPRGRQPRKDRSRQVQELRTLRKGMPQEGHPRIPQARRKADG